jgi:hypothetical protein
VNVSKSVSVRSGSAMTAIRSARKSPAGPTSVSKLPRSVTGTAHPLFDADTDTRRLYWDISLRVNDCPSPRGWSRVRDGHRHAAQGGTLQQAELGNIARRAIKTGRCTRETAECPSQLHGRKAGRLEQGS